MNWKAELLFVAGLALTPTFSFASGQCGSWHFVNPVSSPKIELRGVLKVERRYPKQERIKLLDSRNSVLEHFRLEFLAETSPGKNVLANVYLIGSDAELQAVPMTGRWIGIDGSTSVIWLMNPRNGWFLTIRFENCE